MLESMIKSLHPDIKKNKKPPEGSFREFLVALGGINQGRAI
jgi:hypothetical protein